MFMVIQTERGYVVYERQYVSYVGTFASYDMAREVLEAMGYKYLDTTCSDSGQSHHWYVPVI
jgi:hypothetical protein